METATNPDILVRKHLEELLVGGFAPNVILLQEFDHQKAAIILEGLHFSAWVLLGHMRERQRTLLNFMKDPEKNIEIWGDAIWPENHQPENRMEWENAINEFSKDMDEMISVVRNPHTDLYKVQSNGKTISWAAMACLHHNAYHIGQLKTIGRQLGVW